MPIIEWPDADAPQGTWVADDNIWEELPDGRVIQVARKGQAITRAEAVRLGLVEPPPPPPSAPPPADPRNLTATSHKPRVHRGQPPVSHAATHPDAPTPVVTVVPAPAAAPEEQPPEVASAETEGKKSR